MPDCLGSPRVVKEGLAQIAAETFLVVACAVAVAANTAAAATPHVPGEETTHNQQQTTRTTIGESYTNNW